MDWGDDWGDLGGGKACGYGRRLVRRGAWEIFKHCSDLSQGTSDGGVERVQIILRGGAGGLFRSQGRVKYTNSRCHWRSLLHFKVSISTDNETTLKYMYLNGRGPGKDRCQRNIRNRRRGRVNGATSRCYCIALFYLYVRLYSEATI